MKICIALPWNEYEILDSGRGKKLERFGSVTLIRPEINASWQPALSSEEWENLAGGEFIEKQPGKGHWRNFRNLPEEWRLSYDFGSREMFFLLRLTDFKHVGVFPEQTINWQYLFSRLSGGKRLLNLFAHTGGASMAASLAGGNVTHVDSVYTMVGWARKNAEAADINDIRWICEDSVTFVEKEVKRKSSYHTIIMDPPTYGFSKKGRQWKIERDLQPLLENSFLLLEKGGEIILNCYSRRMEEERLLPLLKKSFSSQPVETERLVLQDNRGRQIDCGYLVRIRRL